VALFFCLSLSAPRFCPFSPFRSLTVFPFLLPPVSASFPLCFCSSGGVPSVTSSPPVCSLF
jgi:hypothetical protein